ncbi:MAG: GGDEF domain-containing protein [Elusimicrobiota bacterium]
MKIGFHALAAAMMFLPSLAVWAAWPRRRRASWIAAAVAPALWGAGFLLVSESERPLWIAVGSITVIACLYAAYAVARNIGDFESCDRKIEQRTKARDTILRKVNELKARIHKIEIEQRESLALYSMIKGLSEALTWEDMKPKLDLAVQQYLGIKDYALFVSGGDSGGFRPLIRKNLSSSVGGSWETLQRYQQEHGLRPRVPHALPPPENALVLPIFEDQKLTGYFFERLPPGADPAALLEKSQTFIDEIAFAFRRVRLFQEVERHSQIDGLTGVHRRGVLDQKLKDEIVRAQTFKTTFCLMMLDIDHFKNINDSYGHPFGDQVLRRIGTILKNSVYETDFVARYGGEEFAILLPRAESAGVLRKAEAVRSAVEAEEFELANERVRVTVSIGIAHFPKDGNTAEAVVRQADQALYSAKEKGRNQVVEISKVRES